ELKDSLAVHAKSQSIEISMEGARSILLKYLSESDILLGI
ncbi:1069_t:CDS:1, partial [Gigaspora margarita]